MVGAVIKPGNLSGAQANDGTSNAASRAAKRWSDVGAPASAVALPARSAATVVVSAFTRLIPQSTRVDPLSGPCRRVGGGECDGLFRQQQGQTDSRVRRSGIGRKLEEIVGAWLHRSQRVKKSHTILTNPANALASRNHAGLWLTASGGVVCERS
ncbi:MAG: hypothetical protein JNL84_09790 [Candidatus Accumulibacter sp.]|nr:hypothetical protein [Accumulibacter sp.]